MNRADTTETELNVPRAVYQVVQRTDNLSLVLLDAGIVAVAWLLAFVAGFESAVPHDVRSYSLLVIGIPVVIQVVGPSAGRPLRPGLALRLGRGGRPGHRRWPSAWRPRQRRARGARPVRGHRPPAVHRAAGRGAAHPARAAAASGSRPGCSPLERQRGRECQVRARAHRRRRGPGCRPGLRARRTRSPAGTSRSSGFVDDDSRPAAPVGPRPAGARHHRTTSSASAQRTRIDRILIALPEPRRERTKPIIDRALRTDAQVKVLRPTRRRRRRVAAEHPRPRPHRPPRPRARPGRLRRHRRLPRGRHRARHRRRRLDRQRDRPPGGPLQPGAPAPPRPRRDPPPRGRRRPARRGRAVLADIRDRDRLDGALRAHAPDVVFHAAAHKHVPILERTPRRPPAPTCSAPGRSPTRPPTTAASASCTSPPTRPPIPCSVMGATKRAAEHVVLAVGRRTTSRSPPCASATCSAAAAAWCRPSSARSSRGARSRSPSPEMTRYFMTIPEAVSLVLQAGAMADEGASLPARHGRAGVDHRAGPPDDPPRRAPPRRGHRDRDHRHPSRRAAARAAARRRRDPRARRPPVDLRAPTEGRASIGKAWCARWTSSNYLAVVTTRQRAESIDDLLRSCGVDVRALIPGDDARPRPRGDGPRLRDDASS